MEFSTPEPGDALTAWPDPSGSSAPSPPQSRFVPGTVIAGRFRIVALLGRGGMGEVYRADDLRLDQPVALKFLPAKYSSDPTRLSHLLREVRLAREITHPSVCRIHDYFEAEGHHFISMEYVDGENLASLLRRIGHLAQAKALEITHQIVAGLAAAHEKGILHRDIKPENIMIDGRGQAHLMDFGIASLRESEPPSIQPNTVLGTPAFMAPELLMGEMGSERSDLYAVGIVLFELFTGQKPFPIHDVAECLRNHLEVPPPRPGDLAKELDPAINQAILRCLEKDPAKRPASARELAAELPGGNALANALAAGITPAPSLVADADVRHHAPLWVLWSLLSATLVLFGLYALLAPRASLMGYLPSAKSAPILLDRCEHILKVCGQSQPQPDVRYYFMINPLHLLRAAQSGENLNRMDQGVSPLSFHYYRAHAGWIQRGWPPLEMDRIVLDHRGRLGELEMAVSKIYQGFQPVGQEPDWPALFREAELDPAAFRIDSQLPLSVQAGDFRKVWIQALPEAGHPPIQVVGIATAGRVTYFGVREPERMASLMDESTAQRYRRGMTIGGLMRIGVFVLGCIMAWVHLVRGRGDRKGALRLALASFLVRLVFGLLAEWNSFHPKSLPDTLSQLLGPALFYGILTWVLYLAAEPFVRRKWPLSMVSWMRLLSGRWKDALVGRDILTGLAVGAFTSVLLGLLRAYPLLPRTAVPQFPFFPASETLLSGSAMLAVILKNTILAVAFGLGVLLVTVLIWKLVRHRFLALGIVYLLCLVPLSVLSGGSFWAFMGVHALIFALPMGVLRRYGLLAFSSFFLTMYVLTWVVGTSDWHNWMGQHSLMAIGLLTALTVTSFATALGGRSPWGVPRGI